MLLLLQGGFCASAVALLCGVRMCCAAIGSLVCRCNVVPQRALQTAGELFDHHDICHASGNTTLPTEGPFYEVMHVRGRRVLQSEQGVIDKRTKEEMQQNGARERDEEYGPGSYRRIFNRASSIKHVQQARLRQTGWLGRFEPMYMSCPLLGRKLPVEAVSGLAAIAWRCDGLGFAWDCLADPMD